MPTPDELARAFTNAINAQDAAALGRLARTYSMLYERMRGKLDSLLLAVNGLENPTRGQIMRLNQYKALVSALEDEIARFGIYTESEITVNMSAAVELPKRSMRKRFITSSVSPLKTARCTRS